MRSSTGPADCSTPSSSSRAAPTQMGSRVSPLGLPMSTSDGPLAAGARTSCSITPKGSSCSASSPLASQSWNPCASLTKRRASAVLPIPGSPVSSATRGWPLRTSVACASRLASSLRLPTNVPSRAPSEVTATDATAVSPRVFGVPPPERAAVAQRRDARRVVAEQIAEDLVPMFVTPRRTHVRGLGRTDANRAAS